MRYRIAIMTALSSPASVLAHPGPHHGLERMEGIIHMLGQHHAPALAVALIIALLYLGRIRARREITPPKRAGDDRKER